jgi:hypothetical protein
VKNLLTVSVFLLTSFHLYAQSDSSRAKPVRAVTFHVSNGVNILQDENLRSIYRTKTLYFWGLGLRLAPVSTNNSVFVSIDYNYSSFSTDVNDKPPFQITPLIDSVLSIGQLVSSVSIKMLEAKEVTLRARAGVIFSFLTDTAQNKERNQAGLKIGFGSERRLSRSQYFEIFLDYDLTKLDGNGFRDYDTIKMGVGFYL